MLALQDESRALRDDIIVLRHLADLPEDMAATAKEAAEFFDAWEGKKDDLRELLLTFYRVLELQLENLESGG